jgi:hypothetical protein
MLRGRPESEIIALGIDSLGQYETGFGFAGSVSRVIVPPPLGK